MIRPFICTCDKRLDVFKRFVNSYNKNAKPYLKRPIIYYDGESKEYHRLIDSMSPERKIKQKYYNPNSCGPYSDTIDYKAICIFPKIIKKDKTFRNERILFLEDDVLFSSKFGEAMGKIESEFNSYHTVDIVTLFGSGNCYWPETHNKANNFIYRFSGKSYYGNLAVIFDANVLQWWRENIDKVWTNEYSGWDVKIGNILQGNRFSFYCTNEHYVQHQVGYSVIAKGHKNQTSSLFRR